MNLLRLMLTVFFLALVVIGCGQGESEESKTKIYFIAKASESEFWQVVMDGARTAGIDLDVEVEVQAPMSESDTDRQISIFNNATLTKPAAIVVAPLLGDSLVGPIEKAVGKGIPVIIIDSAAHTDAYTSFLASDNTRIGTTAGEKMVELLTDENGKVGGKVAGITFLSGGASLEKRKNGFTEEIAKYPDIELLEFQDAQGRQAATISIVKNLVIGNPDLQGIFANNQPTGEETVQALDSLGRKDLAVVVVDSGAEEIRGLREGYVDYVIAQRAWAMGYMGIEYALKAVSGEQLDKYVDTGILVIDKAMLESGAANEVLDPVEYYRKKREKK